MITPRTRKTIKKKKYSIENLQTLNIAPKYRLKNVPKYSIKKAYVKAGPRLYDNRGNAYCAWITKGINCNNYKLNNIAKMKKRNYKNTNSKDKKMADNNKHQNPPFSLSLSPINFKITPVNFTVSIVKYLIRTGLLEKFIEELMELLTNKREINPPNKIIKKALFLQNKYKIEYSFLDHIKTLNLPYILTFYNPFSDEEWNKMMMKATITFSSRIISEINKPIVPGWNLIVINLDRRFIYNRENIPSFIHFLKSQKIPFQIWPITLEQEKFKESRLNIFEIFNFIKKIPISLFDNPIFYRELSFFIEAILHLKNWNPSAEFQDWFKEITYRFPYIPSLNSVRKKNCYKKIRIKNFKNVEKIFYILLVIFSLLGLALYHQYKIPKNKEFSIFKEHPYSRLIWKFGADKNPEYSTLFIRTNQPFVAVIDSYIKKNDFMKDLKEFVKDLKNAAKKPKYKNLTLNNWLYQYNKNNLFKRLYLRKDISFKLFRISPVKKKKDKDDDSSIGVFKNELLGKFGKKNMKISRVCIKKIKIKDLVKEISYPAWFKIGKMVSLLAIKFNYSDINLMTKYYEKGKKIRIPKYKPFSNLYKYRILLLNNNISDSVFRSYEFSSYIKRAEKFLNKIHSVFNNSLIPLIGLTWGNSSLEEFLKKELLSKKLISNSNVNIIIEFYDKTTLKYITNIRNLSNYSVLQFSHLYINKSFIFKFLIY